MINHKTRCSRERKRLDAIEFTPETKRLFYKVLQGERFRFLLDSKDPKNFEGEVAIGKNFTDSEKVWRVLNANCEEKDFQNDPMGWTYDALQYCAEMDFFNIQ